MSVSDRGGAVSQRSDEFASPKRGTDEAEQSRKRAKRSRYISIACNECKRRKIKCNGETPCRRCGHLDLQCVYTPSAVHNFKETQEFQQMNSQIHTLQQAVESLTADMRITRRSEANSPVPPSPAIVQSATQAPSYLPAPKVSLVTSPTLSVENTLDKSLGNHGAALTYTSYSSYVHTTNDPIWAVHKDEALRLTNIWRETVQPILPALNMDRTLQHLDLLYSYLGGASRTGISMTNLAVANAISDSETLKLKLVLATAMAIEGSYDGDMSCQLFTNVVTVAEQLLFKPVDLDNLELLVLTAICAFHKDDEHLAWRLIGLSARMLFEYGINSTSMLESIISKPAAAFRATTLMWTIFVLDRRWSLATGLPAVLKDDDLELYRPNLPYFCHIIELVEMSWRILSNMITKHYHHFSKNIGLLKQMDTDIANWYNKLPQSIKYMSDIALNDNKAAAQDRTPILLFLRTNQTRIATAHPVFLSTHILLSNIGYAEAIVEVAKESIHVLKTLAEASVDNNRYRFANYFLMSSLAIVFLATIHAPNHFSVTSNNEFYTALNLASAERSDSFLGKRLLRTLKVLTQVAQLRKTDSGSEAIAIAGPGRATTIPVDMLSPIQQQPPQFVIADIIGPDDRIEDLTSGLMNLYETPPETHTQELWRYDALTRIFKDLC